LLESRDVKRNSGSDGISVVEEEESRAMKKLKMGGKSRMRVDECES
jgi:hypothetical protein